MSYPESYRYTKQHEWVLVEGDTATIGITDHAQQELGDVIFVDLPKVGKSIAKGETIGSVESVKAVSDIYAPVGGEVLQVNDGLTTNPARLNEDPHGAAWLAKLRLPADVEISDLLSAAEYQNYVGS
jgi:glycine cleavage system H protein